MSGYVKTDEELRRIKAVMTPFRYVIDELGITFETTWEFARWVLPPCFEPIGDKERNVATASAAVYPIQCPHGDNYDVSQVGIGCRYEGYTGSWPMFMLHNTESHIALGRDIWGGAKKLGESRLYHDGEAHYGYGERRGVKLVEIEAQIDGAEQAPMNSTSHVLYLKMIPHSSCVGLEWPPRLNIYEGEASYKSYREGSGTLRLGTSKWDPVHTMPIASVGPAYVAEYEYTCSLADQVDIVGQDEVYARYLWGRSFDDPTLEHIAARWRGETAVNEQA